MNRKYGANSDRASLDSWRFAARWMTSISLNRSDISARVSVRSVGSPTPEPRKMVWPFLRWESAASAESILSG